MLRKFAVVLTGLMLLATAISAQDAKDKDTPAKKIKEKVKSVAKGTPYKVLSVDADAKTIKVEADGKTSSLSVSDKTTILGPSGGKKNGGLKDERLVPGSMIHVVREGNAIKEIYLPRKASGKSTPKATKSTKAKKAAETKAADTKAADTKAEDKKEVEKPKTKKEKAKEKAKKKLDDLEKAKEKTEEKPKDKGK